MSPVYDVSAGDSREAGIDAAVQAIHEGKLVVMPTDTVYGIGANAFEPSAVEALLSAKGRGRERPSAVLVPRPETVEGLAMSVPSYARRLMERFWPGGLTLIFRSQPSLLWDLGETNGTVGLRMPDDEVALEILERTGPLAVSSANRTGEETVTTITEAGFAFGPAVTAYLDGGPRVGGAPSTILDCTKADPVLLRKGAVSPEELREVLGPVELVDATGAPVAEAPDGRTPEEASEPTADEVAPETADDAEGDAPHRASSGDDRDTPDVGVGAEPPFDRAGEQGVDRPIPDPPSND